MVIRADVMGWCFGVKRAVSMTQSALQKTRPVYSLGSLIHNQTTLDSLCEQGLVVLPDEGEGDAEDVPSGSTVIIRAHGTSPRVTDALDKRGCTIIDATCPRVRASQKIASLYARRGRTVIFAGDRGHAEAVSVGTHAQYEAKDGSLFILVQNREEARAVHEGKKAVLLAQTTFNMEEFKAIAEVLKEKFRSLTVKSTICPATRARQESLEELCSQVDGVIVVGGKNSANTLRLLALAEKLCARAALVENADDIPAEFFTLGTVGITAGASTPDNVIDEVESALG